MKMKTLSKKEMDIMAYLRSNSRHTVTQIGRKLAMPRTTVFDKIKKFKNLGLIDKFTAIVNFDKLGHSVCAYVLLKCDAVRKEELGEALTSSAHANNVVRLGNDFDFAAHLIFENMNDMHSYLSILEQKYGIREVKIFYIAKDLKREGFMSNADSCIAVEEGEEL
jgi:Lrp/AsnC family transcriptional regulator for asnA, asnC and gidA